MIFLLRLWRRLFPKYELVKVFRGKWLTKDGELPYDFCWYEIWASDIYPFPMKLKTGGCNPKEHPMYAEAVDYMLRLKSKITKHVEENG